MAQKKKLEDVNKKFEILFNKFRAHAVSDSIIFRLTILTPTRSCVLTTNPACSFVVIGLHART